MQITIPAPTTYTKVDDGVYKAVTAIYITMRPYYVIELCVNI